MRKVTHTIFSAKLALASYFPCLFHKEPLVRTFLASGLFVIVFLFAKIVPGQSRGEHPPAAVHSAHPWKLHLESETDVPFVLVPELNEILSVELALQLSRRFSLGAVGLLNFGTSPPIHAGIGLALRYEHFHAAEALPSVEFLGRFIFDHGFSRFPENILRIEARLTWWIWKYVGPVGRVFADNFPDPFNEENDGEWDVTAGAGLAGRINHHLYLALLGTLRWQDLSALHHLDGPVITPGILLLTEIGLP